MNKKGSIETAINPDIKIKFFFKMEEAGIYQRNSFMRWLLDKWMISESKHQDSLPSSVRSFIVLMAEPLIQRGADKGDAFCISGFRDWAFQVREISRKSVFRYAPRVLKAMIYAVVMCSHDLLCKLLHDHCMESIGRLKFRFGDFRAKIKIDIYNRIKRLYGKSPITVVRYIIDVLLSENSHMKGLIVNNMNSTPPIYTDSNNGKWVAVEIFNDSYRLRLFEFMVEHNIKKRANLIHILIDLALRLPDITCSGVSVDPQYPVEENEVGEYLLDTYDYTAVEYYKYTGL